MCNVYLIHSHKRIRHAQNNLFLFLYSFFFFRLFKYNDCNECVEWHFSTELKTNDSSFIWFVFVCFFQLSTDSIEIDSKILIFFSQQSFFIHFTFQCRPIFAPEKKINQIDFEKLFLFGRWNRIGSIPFLYRMNISELIFHLSRIFDDL